MPLLLTRLIADTRVLGGVLVIALLLLAWARVSYLSHRVDALETETVLQAALLDEKEATLAALAADAARRAQEAQEALDAARARARQGEATIARLRAAQRPDGVSACDAAAALLESYRRGTQ